LQLYFTGCNIATGPIVSPQVIRYSKSKHLYFAIAPSPAMLLLHSSSHRALQPLMQQQMKSMRSLLHCGHVSADIIPARAHAVKKKKNEAKCG
jgi:hypothetical protein